MEKGKNDLNNENDFEDPRRYYSEAAQYAVLFVFNAIPQAAYWSYVFASVQHTPGDVIRNMLEQPLSPIVLATAVVGLGGTIYGSISNFVKGNQSTRLLIDNYNALQQLQGLENNTLEIGNDGELNEEPTSLGNLLASQDDLDALES